MTYKSIPTELYVDENVYNTLHNVSNEITDIKIIKTLQEVYEYEYIAGGYSVFTWNEYMHEALKNKVYSEALSRLEYVYYNI